MRTAEQAYRQAVNHSRAIAERVGDLPHGHTEGDQARHQAARAEAAALEMYRNAVEAFGDWVLYGKAPASHG